MRSQRWPCRVQPDGKIVVAGAVTVGPETTDVALMRFGPRGALDRTFGHDGKVSTSLGEVHDVANAVTISRDGRIKVAGMAQSHETFADKRRFSALLRNTADGRSTRRSARTGY